MAEAEADLASRVIQSSQSSPILVGIVERTGGGTPALPCYFNVRAIGEAVVTVAEGETSGPEAGEDDLVPVAFFDRVPLDGEYVIASYQMPMGRWVARWRTSFDDGSPTGSFLPCHCDPAPATITMTSALPLLNFGMFKSATIQWGAAPAFAAPLGLVGNIYLSTSSFTDLIEPGSPFYYLLTCSGGTIALSRIYQTSSNGSPYRDANLYTWALGQQTLSGSSSSGTFLTNGCANTFAAGQTLLNPARLRWNRCCTENGVPQNSTCIPFCGAAPANTIVFTGTEYPATFKCEAGNPFPGADPGTKVDLT